MNSDVPLSHADLSYIAKHLRSWERLLVNSEGYTDRAELVSRIEIDRPNDPGQTIGHFVLYDGWVGFEPLTKDTK